eukprot:scaffold16258_cov141-Isochrysis_galbana.AAC.3
MQISRRAPIELTSAHAPPGQPAQKTLRRSDAPEVFPKTLRPKIESRESQRNSGRLADPSQQW